MKRLILVLALAVLGWAGWWFWSAYTLRGTVEAWFEARQNDGWVASYSDLAVRGFPNRLDLTLSELILANPHTQILWEAPFFQIMSLSYKPQHKILIFPNSQSLSMPSGDYEITSDGLRASVVFAENGIIDRLNAEAEILNWQGTALAGATAALLRQEEAQYQFALVADSIANADTSQTPLAKGRINDARLNTTVTFDKDWAAAALTQSRPQPVHIDVTLMSYLLESLQLDMAGAVSVDASGRASGDLTLRAVNWQQALEQSRAGSQLATGITEKLVQGLSIVAGLKGRPDTLDLPLTLDSGQISLGLIPLGPAPRLQIP